MDEPVRAPQEPVEDSALERAYARGDHRTARTLARQLIERAAPAESLARAQQILAFTAPDRFLSVVGALGLGLVAWLVYNYVL